MLPLTGWLANAYGRREIFLVSIVLFVAASALCGAAAASLPQTCAVSGCCKAWAARRWCRCRKPSCSRSTRPRIMAAPCRSGAWARRWAPMLGPVLGGWLTDSYSWRWVFYINLPIGLAAFAGLTLSLPKSRRTRAATLLISSASRSLCPSGGVLPADAGSRPDAGLVFLPRNHFRGDCRGALPFIFSWFTPSPATSLSFPWRFSGTAIMWRRTSSCF